MLHLHWLNYCRQYYAYFIIIIYVNAEYKTTLL